MVVEYRGMEENFLFLPDTTLTLPHVRSGSGAKYSEGPITFWPRGEQAFLERDGRAVNCVMNRRASIVEDAMLSGMDFWATGNEPGWTLEIGSETSVLVMNYGEDRRVRGAGAVGRCGDPKDALRAGAGRADARHRAHGEGVLRLDERRALRHDRHPGVRRPELPGMRAGPALRESPGT